MNTLDFYFGHFLHICVDLNEPKDNRGLTYPSGIVMFSMMLCTCAGREGQRSKARWLEYKWSWIYSLWTAANGRVMTKKVKSISQSTISRFKSPCVLEDFIAQMNQFHKQQFLSDFEDLVKLTFEKDIDRGNVPLPHYCVDGKSREGCLSETTGRTEVDVTVYNPETSTPIILLPLEDKQGERSGVSEIIENEMDDLPEGLFTADAGITGVKMVKNMADHGHDYLLQIKGNAGHAFEEVKEIPWEKVKDMERFENSDNGRKEVKILQRFDIEFVDCPDKIDQYQDITNIFRLESWVKRKSKISHSFRYFIGSSGISGKPLSYIYNTIRQHWKIETYHWRKDTILREDDCLEKDSIKSRTLSRINSFVDYVGNAVFGSTKEFVDRFSSAPEQLAFSGNFL